jgi:hypothetical protein
MNDTAATSLGNAAVFFARTYNAREDLVAEQRGWTRVIVLCAHDTDEAVAVHVHDGRVVDVRERAAPADVVITADAATLRDILELRRSPNEPYLFGDLTVRGSEADYLRLDYITERLCPES